MAINFPDSPAISDTITVGDITWTWDGTSWVATGGPSGGGGTDLTAFSVSTQSASSGGSLAYNNVSGVFTFRPADLTGFLTANSVTPGTYGSATQVPQITVDADGLISSITQVAVSSSDTSIERFKLNYATNGDLSTTSDLTSGISSVTIDSVTGGDVTITFNNANYNLPPAGILMYGYDYLNNTYVVSPLETTMTLRSVAAGGSSGSPTLFDGADTVELRLRLTENQTGASRSFGTTTHAWIQFSMAG